MKKLPEREPREQSGLSSFRLRYWDWSNNHKYFHCSQSRNLSWRYRPFRGFGGDKSLSS
jgi:hypothetical protein